MRLIPALLGLLGTPALAVTPDQTAIQQCSAVEQAYGSWAYNARGSVERGSTDKGGWVDQSLVVDFNFALVSARDFVHENIQYVQRARFRGSKPDVRDCKAVTAMARNQIEQYARTLFLDIHATDRGSRDSHNAEFRMGLHESTARFQSSRE